MGPVNQVALADILSSIRLRIYTSYSYNRAFLIKYKQIFTTYKELVKTDAGLLKKVTDEIRKIEIVANLMEKELYRFFQLDDLEEVKLIFLKFFSYTSKIFQSSQDVLETFQKLLVKNGNKYIIIYRADTIAGRLMSDFKDMEKLLLSTKLSNLTFAGYKNIFHLIDHYPQSINYGLTKLTVLAYHQRPSYIRFSESTNSLESKNYLLFLKNYKSDGKLIELTKQEYKEIMDVNYLILSVFHQGFIELCLFYLNGCEEIIVEKDTLEILNNFHEAFIFIKMFSSSDDRKSVTRDTIISINNLVIKPLESLYNLQVKIDKARATPMQVIQGQILFQLKEINHLLNANTYKLDVFYKNPSIHSGFLLAKNEYQQLLFKMTEAQKSVGFEPEIDIYLVKPFNFELFKDLKTGYNVSTGFYIADSVDF